MLARQPRDRRDSGQCFTLAGLHLRDKATRERDRTLQIGRRTFLAPKRGKRLSQKGRSSWLSLGFSVRQHATRHIQALESGLRRMNLLQDRSVSVEH